MRCTKQPHINLCVETTAVVDLCRGPKEKLTEVKLWATPPCAYRHTLFLAQAMRILLYTGIYQNWYANLNTVYLYSIGF